MNALGGHFRTALVALGGALVLAGAGCSDSGEGNEGEGTGFIIGDQIVLSIEPESITFGDVAVGSSAVQEVTLRHLGNQGTLKLRDMVIASVSNEFTLDAPDDLTLEPGDSLTFSVTYKPVDDIVDSGKVTFNTNITVPGGATLVGEVPISSLKPYGQVVAQPSVLDFGAVPGGTSVTEKINFRSIGTLGVSVTDIKLKAAGVSDFEIVSMPTLPYDVSADGSFDVEVSYTPTKGDVDSIQLQLDYVADATTLETTVLIKGTEISPRMVVFPNPINFDKVDPDVEHTIPLSISNQGSQPLEVSGISVETQGDWSYTVTLDGLPAFPVTLADNTPLSLTVKFNPPSDMPVLTSPIASVRIDSNDPAGNGVTQVPVFGSPQAPSLQVQPGDLVDFGFVAQNQTATRSVTFFNAGTADLVITQVAQQDESGVNPGEYAVKNADLWGPTATPATSVTLAGGENAQVNLTFTNNGASTGTAWGKLIIDSTDPATPSWEVNLKAQRAGSPTCEVQLVPDQVDYGIVPRGFSKTLTFNLVNVGSGSCGYLNSFVNDCSGWGGGFFATTCTDPNTTVQTDGNSDTYAVTDEPFSAAGNLKPGQSYPIKVTFTPPESAPLFGDEFEDYAALLAVRVTHPYTQDGTVETVIWPKDTAGSYPPNLHAKSGIAELSVFPGELDFGLTTIGCHSQTLTVNAYNVGSAPLDMSGFELQGCSPEFKLKGYPPLTEPDGNGGFKKTLQPDEGVQFDLAYAPQDEGDDTDGDGTPDQGDECALAIYTNGSTTPAAVVPLAGIGTFDTEHTDEFIQKSGQDVDVLFVVDNSGSMGEEQSNLSNNFSQFINEALTWSNDYHLAVVTTDIDGDGAIFQGTPRVVTPATASSFAGNVKVGTSGSGTEQGMLAAQLALSLPLISDSTTVCTTDADCNAPDGCIEGFCGGPNRGFLRKDAALEIVFLSDEEDQSPSDLSFYENFFKNIKGFYNSNLLHVHAIVGPPGGCSSNSGDAAAGNRYWDLAGATGGNQISICEPDFAVGLKSIGEIAFGLKVQFFLTRVPDPTTIEVKVNDIPCDSAGGANWLYDSASNAVVFKEDGACMPQPGEPVWMHYETICFLE